MSRNFFSKLKFLAMVLPIVSNLENATATQQSEEVRPLFTEEQLSNSAFVASVTKMFYCKIQMNLNDLNPDNLNKNFNNGKDLFDLNVIDETGNNQKSRREVINSKLKNVLTIAQQYGAGLYDIVAFKTEKLLTKIKDGLFKEDKNYNYEKLLAGIKDIFAPTEIDDEYTILSDDERNNDSFELDRDVFKDINNNDASN